MAPQAGFGYQLIERGNLECGSAAPGLPGCLPVRVSGAPPRPELFARTRFLHGKRPVKQEFIGLQDHGSPVSFRSIGIKEIK